MPAKRRHYVFRLSVRPSGCPSVRPSGVCMVNLMSNFRFQAFQEQCLCFYTILVLSYIIGDAIHYWCNETSAFFYFSRPKNFEKYEVNLMSNFLCNTNLLSYYNYGASYFLLFFFRLGGLVHYPNAPLQFVVYLFYFLLKCCGHGHPCLLTQYQCSFFTVYKKDDLSSTL